MNEGDVTVFFLLFIVLFVVHYFVVGVLKYIFFVVLCRNDVHTTRLLKALATLS